MTSIVAGIAHWIAVWSTAMPAGVNVVSSAEKLQAASAEIGDATVRTADTETNRRTYRIRLISTRHPTRLLDLRTHAPSARHRRRQQTSRVRADGQIVEVAATAIPCRVEQSGAEHTTIGELNQNRNHDFSGVAL
jgi:hypothetical protein